MTARQFPNLTPTGRSYKPGRIPETVFTAQNGSTPLCNLVVRWSMLS